jgi:putative glutamine amidotransferase
MKKIIGVYADVANGRVGQTAPYMQFLGQFGNVRLILPTDNLREVAKSIDMLVLPGGSDINSAKYNQAPDIMTGRPNMHFDYLDANLLPLVIEMKKPILGICRGMQALNVHFGGTLNQHVIGHHQGDNRAATKQEIQFEDGKKPHMINSMHHQSVNILGDGFEIVAYSQCYQGCYSEKKHVRNWYFVDDKKKKEFFECIVIIEMIKHKNLPIVGVQWHPEEFNCKVTVDCINTLLKEYEEKVSSPSK